MFVFLLFVIACNPSKPAGADKTTTVFSYYLKTAFGDSIRNEKHTYVLVPITGCKGCRSDALILLHDEILKSGEKDLTYIFSPALQAADSLAKPCKLLIDTSALIDRINLPISNITIVKTEKGKVISLVSIRGEMMDSIGYYLKH